MTRTLFLFFCIIFLGAVFIEAGTLNLDEQLIDVVQYESDIQKVEALLNDGANPNARNDQAPVLAIAAGEGNTDIVKLLLDRGADVDAKANNGATALCIAVDREYPEIVRLLIAQGADVNIVVSIAPDNPDAPDAITFELTPLMVAKINENTEIVELLEKAGAIK